MIHRSYHDNVEVTMIRILFFLTIIFAIGNVEGCPENILRKMTLEKKIGQLFIAGVYSSREDAISEGQNQDPTEYIVRMIRDYHIGGVLFKMRWDPEQVFHQTRYFQEFSEVPLFMTLDAEWGLNMRMSHAVRFPKNQTLGAIKNERLIYEMGREIGRQCRLIGINWNFSPVVDINTNPRNPIINDRSFGSNKEDVARKGILMIRGLQEEGILATAKHFPGHGDTLTDSHTGLPVLKHTKSRLYDEELVPFMSAIGEGVKSVMCAHLMVPALDDTLPTSLSRKTATVLLQEKLGFKGLVVTDDLLMDAISKKYPPGEAALLAFLAGNDVILSSKDIEVSIATIKQAVVTGRISEEEIDRRVLKILDAKAWIDRDHDKSLRGYNESDLFTAKTYQLKKNLYSEAVHIHRDRKGTLPLDAVSDFALLQIGGEGFAPFNKAMDPQGNVSRYCLSQNSEVKEKKGFSKLLGETNAVVISLMGMSRSVKENYGVSDVTIESINELARQQKDVVLVIFGNPSIATQFNEDISIIHAYEDDTDAQLSAAELLFGKFAEGNKKEGPSQ